MVIKSIHIWRRVWETKKISRGKKTRDLRCFKTFEFPPPTIRFDSDESNRFDSFGFNFYLMLGTQFRGTVLASVSISALNFALSFVSSNDTRWQHTYFKGSYKSFSILVIYSSTKYSFCLYSWISEFQQNSLGWSTLRIKLYESKGQP